MKLQIFSVDRFLFMLVLNSDVRVDSMEMLKFVYISPLNVNLATFPFMTIIELFKFYIIML